MQRQELGKASCQSVPENQPKICKTSQRDYLGIVPKWHFRHFHRGTAFVWKMSITLLLFRRDGLPFRVKGIWSYRFQTQVTISLNVQTVHLLLQLTNQNLFRPHCFAQLPRRPFSTMFSQLKFSPLCFRSWHILHTEEHRTHPVFMPEEIKSVHYPFLTTSS